MCVFHRIICAVIFRWCGRERITSWVWARLRGCWWISHKTLKSKTLVIWSEQTMTVVSHNMLGMNLNGRRRMSTHIRKKRNACGLAHSFKIDDTYMELCIRSGCHHYWWKVDVKAFAYSYFVSFFCRRRNSREQARERWTAQLLLRLQPLLQHLYC